MLASPAYHRRSLAIGLSLLVAVGASRPATSAPVDLTELSIEDLMEVEISTVSRKAVRLSEAPAAVHVVSRDDIRRMGVTNIPEALRMVPGLEVGQVDANKWAITARGYNGLFANKLLVQIDGRSLYTPLFSGVFWEMQDVVPEDLDRIEVVRGPGATLWGANAVNGIINVVTRDARDTQGTFLSASVGNAGNRFATARYGDRIGSRLFYRVYAKHADRGPFRRDNGETAADAWTIDHGGLRVDCDITPADALTVTADLYDGDVGQTYSVVTAPEPAVRSTFDAKGMFSGGHVLSRWKHTFSNASDVTAQVYFDNVERRERVLAGTVNTFDFDSQHRLGLGARNEFIWGVGYRLVRDHFDDTFTVTMNPKRRSTSLWSAFAQNETKFLGEKLRFTVGSKVEYEDVVGGAVEPNMRLLYSPTSEASFWAAASRAVRTPSRAEADARIATDVVTLPSGAQGILTMVGTRDYRSEVLLGFESGCRFTIGDRTYIDVAAYHNRYDRLRTLELGLPYNEADPAPYTLVPVTLANKLAAVANGGELYIEHRPTQGWVLRGSYTYLHVDAHLDPTSSHLFSELVETEIPTHQATLRSSWTVRRNIELDVQARFVDALPGLGVDRYAAVDARAGWLVRDGLEISLVGRDLLGANRYENRPSYSSIVPAKTVRTLLISLTWRP